MPPPPTPAPRRAGERDKANVLTGGSVDRNGETLKKCEGFWHCDKQCRRKVQPEVLCFVTSNLCLFVCLFVLFLSGNEDINR